MKQFLLALISLAALSGCASVGTINIDQPLSGKLGHYKTVSIETASYPANCSEEMAQLEIATIGKLRAAQLFDTVISRNTSPDAAAELQLKVNIVNLNRVSPGSRIMLGALAGQATIVLRVGMTDESSGQSIGSFIVEGKSSGGSIFAGTTPEAIDRAVEKIVEFVVNNM